MSKTDFLVIGSGISGLNFALNAAKKGQVTLVTKKRLLDSNTNFAQGGIAAVLGKTDNIEAHIKDTLEAGAHHNNQKAVRFMVEHSAEAIYRLIEMGVEFEKEKGIFKLGREGGHLQRRIAFIGDRTGAEIEKILIKRVKEHLNIKILENSFASDLIVKNRQCFGGKIIRNNKIEEIMASKTILATGGIGQIYKYTTNPKVATADGLAMAIRAGVKTKDLEFIQFHPTALDKPLSPLFLLSEALRGEGAHLINSSGKRFMTKLHPQTELAPRDIISREIYRQLKSGPVYLKLNKSNSYLKNRFPVIYKKLIEIGINPAKDLIPVTPAAHYICGGIKTDLKGKTNLKNLFAFGEVAATGVHGANRLASNSLLEALVFSNQILSQLKIDKSNTPKAKKEKSIEVSPDSIRKSRLLKKEIRKIMWTYCGILRDLKQIKNHALPQMKKLLQATTKLSKSPNQEIIETQNMATASLAILQAASKRKKSLGCHFVI